MEYNYIVHENKKVVDISVFLKIKCKDWFYENNTKVFKMFNQQKSWNNQFGEKRPLFTIFISILISHKIKKKF